MKGVKPTLNFYPPLYFSFIHAAGLSQEEEGSGFVDNTEPHVKDRSKILIPSSFHWFVDNFVGIKYNVTYLSNKNRIVNCLFFPGEYERIERMYLMCCTSYNIHHTAGFSKGDKSSGHRTTLGTNKRLLLYSIYKIILVFIIIFYFTITGDHLFIFFS